MPTSSRRAGLAEIEGSGSGAADPAAQANYAMHAHGAVFAEVKVDPDLGQIRVTRLVGAFAAGRIINPRLVRSQLFGGMIWGVSFALHEEAVIDRRSGRVMNANLAEYHVPGERRRAVARGASLVDEHDPHVNALGIKGVGEIGITGTCRCGRQCGLACDRRARAALSDPDRGVGGGARGLRGSPSPTSSQSPYRRGSTGTARRDGKAMPRH